MKKVLMWGGVGIGGFVVLIFVIATISVALEGEVAEDGTSGGGTSPVPTQAKPPTITPETGRLDAGTYLNNVGESIAPAISTNFGEMGKLFSSPLPDNDAWRSEVQKRAEVLIAARDEAAGMEPPEILDDTHKSLMEGLDLYAEGAQFTLTWLDTNEDKNLVLAASKFVEGQKLISLATLQMVDVGKQYAK